MADQVYIAGTREHLTSELRRVLTEIEAAPAGASVDVSIYGNWNLGSGDATVTFTNDDMENRPEVATTIFVDIE